MHRSIVKPFIGIAGLSASLALVSAAQAQSALCPTSINVQGGDKTGFVLENGACTNRKDAGAYSGAALASQALSSLTQTSTAESNRTAQSAVGNRREEEQQRSAQSQAQARARADAARNDRNDDETRRRRQRDAEASRAADVARSRESAAVDRRAKVRAEATRARQAEAAADAERARAARAERASRAQATADAAAAREEATAMERRAAARAEANRAARAEAASDAARMRAMRQRVRAAEPRDMEELSPAVAPRPRGLVHKGYDPVDYTPVDYVVLPEGPRIGAFAQGFGDYERRYGRGPGNIQCCFGLGGLPNPLILDVRSSTTTAGFIGGVDVTGRNLFEAGDGIIAGVLTGYIATDLSVTTRSLSLSPNVGNGFGQLRANLSGPSLGFFSTYFNGPLSVDLTYKADLLDLDERFTDSLAFAAQLTAPIEQATFVGGGRASLTTHSLIGNANYRIPLSTTLWLEPTTGIQYTATNYGRGAARLGLDNGDLFRVQGGLRFGSTFTMDNQTLVTASFASLAYSNVHIQGGFLPGVGFEQNNILVRADEGRVRGLGVLTLAFDHRNGYSWFVQGNVRGGENLFGAGGRAGLRYQW